MKKTTLSLLLLTIFTLSSCTNTATPPAPTKASPPTPTQTEMPTSEPTEMPTASPTPQPRLTPQSYGIDLEDFPENYNPLTGRAVQDATLLELPAVLVSISNSPASARPQAGIGFASWVFEYYIGEAATRFLSVFYGDYPRYIPNLTGGCPVNETIFTPSENWVGNRVWLDENENGIQDDWETGVGGVCVRLYTDGKLTASTSTNSNGYYAFNIPFAEKNYFIEVDPSENYTFTLANVGNDDQDSDVDADTGRTRVFRIESTETNVDAGLIPVNQQIAFPTPSAAYIPTSAYVGPIRSGRLTYDYVNKMFPQSCLVFAGAAPDILAQLNPCKIMRGVDPTTPNSALLPVDEMRQLAESNGNGKMPNYSGNLFDGILPQSTREAATSLSVYYHAYDQSYWEYDPLSQSYLRFTDDADGLGIFHPATDRLTGRQQSFENVIVLQAEHLVFRHNQLKVDLGMSLRGFAYLFRDGTVQKVYWSTENRDWEKKSGMLRPIHFTDVAGNPIALRPGRTWVHLVTLASVMEGEEGAWKMTFIQPYDPLPEE